VKVAVVLVEGTVTDAGTCAARVLPLSNMTLTPPKPAGAVSVTVPVTGFPPFTETGFRSSLASETVPTGITVSVADCEIDRYAAVIVTVSNEVAPVEMVTLAESCPPGMETTCGTIATGGRLLVKWKFAPPNGAGLPKVTVPVTESPLVAESLLSENVNRGLMVSAAVFDTPEKLAVMVTI
jgi:hypothetical protein